MAKITLDRLRHVYPGARGQPDVEALKRLDLTFDDGGAYALLGPSGCGKTTMLNIISGLLRPAEGRVLFNDADVTALAPDQRHIAQVFQFPVIYDTMTIYDNLAFPLRNRKVPAAKIDTAVREIAAMLDLTDRLGRRARGLTADGKQKLSLGRGLVRDDVNVIMFDEPLTVIDPHLKWQLRSKLKELHQRMRFTMIYVTHDQTEALTFADRVVVMNHGEVVQSGTPVELFETPAHTFVGHFIGSPGMNLLPCTLRDGRAICLGHPVATATPPGPGATSPGPGPATTLHLGVRPEYVSFADHGLPARVVRVSDAGRYRIVEAEIAGTGDARGRVKLLVEEGAPIPSDATHLRLDPARTRIYADGWMVT